MKIWSKRPKLGYFWFSGVNSVFQLNLKLLVIILEPVAFSNKFDDDLLVRCSESVKLLVDRID